MHCDQRVVPHTFINTSLSQTAALLTTGYVQYHRTPQSAGATQPRERLICEPQR